MSSPEKLTNVHIPVCVECGTKDASRFNPSMVKQKRNWCRDCTKIRTAKYRGADDVAKKLLFNIKQRCRAKHLPEGSLWRLEDVEKLLEKWTPPSSIIPNNKRMRLRVVQLDETKPLLPENVQIVPFGCGNIINRRG
jgi:hypothetical protein